MGIYDRDYMRRDPPERNGSAGNTHEERLVQGVTRLYQWVARRWRILLALFAFLLLAAIFAPK